MKRVLNIKNDIAEITTLATFIEELGEELELPMATTMSLNLALEEIVSNIILYAYPQKMSEDIEVATIWQDGQLVFTISDNGVEFDPTKVLEADVSLPAEEREIGGLGIFLVNKIMDEVNYTRIDNKNILTISKELK